MTTEQAQPQLPPLPEADGYAVMSGSGTVIVPPSEFAKHNAYAIFSAEQMRAYALAAANAREAAVRAELEADAMRYRHLCSQGSIIPRPSLWDAGVGFTGLEMPHTRGAISKAELDAVIDSARTAAGKEQAP